MSGEGNDALSMLQKAAAFHRKRVQR